MCLVIFPYISLYREETGPERESDLPKVTQQDTGEVQLQAGLYSGSFLTCSSCCLAKDMGLSEKGSFLNPLVIRELE
jgi:hypothetical protein